jgi:hypothetical protein
MSFLNETNFPADAMARVLDYVAREESRHYRDCSPRERRNHIYNSVRQLQDWLHSTAPIGMQARALCVARNTRIYFDWFLADNKRETESLLELAQYLDNERSAGRFADGHAVQGMMELASEPTAATMFEHIMKYLREFHIEQKRRHSACWDRPDDEEVPF